MRQLDQHLAIINQHSHRSLDTQLFAYTLQSPLQENKQNDKADASNEPNHSTEEAIIATDKPETGTSLGNGVKIKNNLELQNEKVLNNIDTRESLSFQLKEKGKTNRKEYDRMKEEEVRLSVDNNEVSLIHSSKHEPHKINIPAISIDNKSNIKVELNNKELFFEQSHNNNPNNSKKDDTNPNVRKKRDIQNRNTADE